MNKKAVETISVNAVRDSIVCSDFLDQYIPDNDKEPSWDGSVYIYTDKSKTKDKLKGRIPVQVKGTEKDDFGKEEISFPVSTVDLKNYLNDGGAVFFVVYIGQKGLRKQIYYSELPPIKLKMYLAEAKGQKTKSIKLKKFPSDSNEKATIFFQCFENCQKQASFSNVQLLSLEELEKQGVLKGINIPVSAVGGIDPLTALLKNEVYVYAELKGSSIPQPLEIIPTNMCTQEKEPANISIGDKKFYHSLNRIRSAKQTKCIFGESFSITLNKNDTTCKINYKNSDNIRVLAKDLDFIITYIEEGYFSLNGHQMKFDYDNANISNFNIDEQKKHLQSAKEIVQLLDILGCDKDIDINDLSNSDWLNLDRLVRGLIHKKPIKIKLENFSPVQIFNVGKLRFAICLTLNDKEKGTYYLSDFFKTELPTCIKLESGEIISVSQYLILKKNDLNNLDNIRYEVLLPSFQKSQRHCESISRANWFFLELLSAYDESGNQHLIETAKEFSLWLCDFSEEELPYAIKELNKFQVIKRMRDFTIEEVREIYSIIEDGTSTDDIRAGGYLLIDQQPMAEICFERLDDTIKEEFKKYPIYHFWKTEEKDNE